MIILNKIPIQHKYCHNAVNFILDNIQNVSHYDVVLGNIPFILGGDMAQQKEVRCCTNWQWSTNGSCMYSTVLSFAKDSATKVDRD